MGSATVDVHANPRRLHILGVTLCIFILWNGVCDLIYGYSSTMSGRDYFSPAVIDMIVSAEGRSHGVMLLAQTAGWLYPFYAFYAYVMWVGMRRAGFWMAHVPCGLIAYAILMIGGIQHCGWAFLTVPSQAARLVGSTDNVFYDTTQRYIADHFFMGDLTAVLALNLGCVWQAVAVASGRTSFPRWFVAVSPLGALVISSLIGLCLPAPLAGLVLAPFGTWIMLVPCLSCTVWMWNRVGETTPGGPEVEAVAKGQTV
ncbi:hypothetical protein KIPB_000206 [Kipferlia bialata]|uniref:DUF4386 family protein n=1 Tax=Kipferlia bialata TaxID=797122 RepID=A0A391NHY5_9EUKA|nr:hypothetical protein KIPB_000206 [Kipferlia bialata]|eukprot:g206.t1